MGILSGLSVVRVTSFATFQAIVVFPDSGFLAKYNNSVFL